MEPKNQAKESENERLRPSGYEPKDPIDFKSGISTGTSRSIN